MRPTQMAWAARIVTLLCVGVTIGAAVPYDDVRARPTAVLYLDSEELGEELAMAILKNLWSGLGRDLYVTPYDIRAEHRLLPILTEQGLHDLHRGVLAYADAAIGIGARFGKVHERLSWLRDDPAQNGAIVRFVALVDIEPRSQVRSDASAHLLPPHLQLESADPRLHCCDKDTLRALCDLQSTKPESNDVNDNHPFERRGVCSGDFPEATLLQRRLRGECESSSVLQCMDCKGQGRSLGQELVWSITGVVPPDEFRSIGAAPTDGDAKEQSSQLVLFRSRSDSFRDLNPRRWHNRFIPSMLPDRWALLRQTTCCDAHGRLIVHVHSPNQSLPIAGESESEATTLLSEYEQALGNVTLPSSNYLTLNRPILTRSYLTPYDRRQCVHIKNVTFLTMHGHCPSSAFLSGNYAHSIVDFLVPMFDTLQFLEGWLDAEQRSNDFLVLAQIADPPKRGAVRRPSNCEQMAAALGFHRPAKPWDALAVGRRRYCFDSLVLGMSMDLAIGDVYTLSFDGLSRRAERETQYARFVDIVRLNAASIFFAPPPDSLHVALAVRSHSRRIVNHAEVSAELAMLTGSAPLLIDFERLSVQEMLTALLPIQLLVGMYGSGLMNGMFICNLGEPHPRAFHVLQAARDPAKNCASMESSQGCAYFADCPGVVISIIRDNMGEENVVAFDASLVAAALTDKTIVWWILRDPLLSFPHRGGLNSDTLLPPAELGVVVRDSMEHIGRSATLIERVMNTTHYAGDGSCEYLPEECPSHLQAMGIQCSSFLPRDCRVACRGMTLARARELDYMRSRTREYPAMLSCRNEWGDAVVHLPVARCLAESRSAHTGHGNQTKRCMLDVRLYLADYFTGIGEDIVLTLTSEHGASTQRIGIAELPTDKKQSTKLISTECKAQAIMKLYETQFQVELSEQPQVIRLQLNTPLSLTHLDLGASGNATGRLQLRERPLYCSDEFRLSIGLHEVRWQPAA